MRSCIKQFDNDICIKANKQSLIDLDLSLEQKYIKQKELHDLIA